jgi:GNAT superfamily N-acetyltransferase
MGKVIGQTSKEVVIEEVKDLDAAWTKLRALFKEFEAYNQSFEPRDLVPDWEERLKSRFRLNEDRLILVARDSDDFAGCLIAVVRRDEGLATDVFAYLSYAFIRPEYRAQGIGTHLLKQAEDWCRARGARRIELDVFIENALGMRFWSHAGFRPHSTTMRKQLEVPA